MKEYVVFMDSSSETKLSIFLKFIFRVNTIATTQKQCGFCALKVRCMVICWHSKRWFVATLATTKESGFPTEQGISD